jgi:hypothetical protein
MSFFTALLKNLWREHCKWMCQYEEDSGSGSTVCAMDNFIYDFVSKQRAFTPLQNTEPVTKK